MHSNLGLFFRMFQIRLHIADTCDNLEHLGVEGIELFTFLEGLFLF